MMNEPSDTVHGAERDTSTSRNSRPSADLGGSSSGFSSSAPGSIQLEEIQDPSETRRGRSGHANTYKPLIATIKQCLPEESLLRKDTNPYFASTIQTKSRIVLLLDGRRHYARPDLSPGKVWGQIEAANPRHAIIAVEEIDDVWGEALCARYPDSIDEQFLLEHILGVDFVQDDEYLLPLPPDQQLTRDSTKRDILHIANAFYGKDRLEERSSPGFHINYWFETEGERNRSSFSLMNCVFRNLKNGYMKLNHRISYCQLSENTCLVLFTPSSSEDENLIFSNFCVQHDMAFSGPVVVRIPIYNRSVFPWARRGHALWDLLYNDWPVFVVWKAASEALHPPRFQIKLGPNLLAMLLTVRTLQRMMDYVKRENAALVYSEQIMDDQCRFTALTRFRRSLGPLHSAVHYSKTIMKDPAYLLDDDLSIKATSETESAQPAEVESTEGQKHQNLSMILLHELDEMQIDLRYAKDDLNEEIQVAIGAVQVNDAQVMRRQTNVTVVLTILAAIYLPMTLVTGIFGMNVVEVSQIPHAPRAWWVVVTWAAVVVLTAIVGFVIWRGWNSWTAWRAAYQKSLDVESGYESDETSGSSEG